jgi:hypothetical protein
MATIENILLRESKRVNCVTLYREGIFLIAYDWSAYLFSRYIREYSVRKKHYKVVGRDVCSLGFPQKVFSTVAEAWKDSTRQTDEGFEIVIPTKDADKEMFASWEQDILVRPPAEKTSKSAPPMLQSETGGHVKIIDHIRAFDLVNQTPMQCVAFIAEMQNQLKQIATASS